MGSQIASPSPEDRPAKEKQTRPTVLYFFRRGGKAIAFETRLNPEGPGFQLVITENGEAQVEDFADLPALLGREHELLRTWRESGWRDVGGLTRAR
jgi:hypothetical protein